MQIEAFLDKLKQDPNSIEFTDTMKVIEENYHFTETAFSNGAQNNSAGENSGSCKLFAFAQLQQLDEASTLACFGQYYRDDVLAHPDATDHQNIRQFMQSGWQAVKFEGQALNAK